MAFADVAPIRFLTAPDGGPLRPTFFRRLYGCRNCGIEEGDTVGGVGFGPVGQFACIAPVCSAPAASWIDLVPERLQCLRKYSRA